MATITAGGQVQVLGNSLQKSGYTLPGVTRVNGTAECGISSTILEDPTRGAGLLNI